MEYRIISSPHFSYSCNFRPGDIYGKFEIWFPHPVKFYILNFRSGTRRELKMHMTISRKNSKPGRTSYGPILFKIPTCRVHWHTAKKCRAPARRWDICTICRRHQDAPPETQKQFRAAGGANVRLCSFRCHKGSSQRTHEVGLATGLSRRRPRGQPSAGPSCRTSPGS